MKFWQRPYGDGMRSAYRTRQAFLFGLFVGFFLWYFEPFGLQVYGDRLLSLSLGFALITTLIMLLLNVGLPRLRPSWFWTERWNVGKEIFWTVLNLSFIGLGNVLFFAWWNGSPISWPFVLWFQSATWAVGAFPILLLVLLREQRLRQRYQRETAQLTGPDSASKAADTAVLHFPSENKGEDLALQAHQFRFAQSADNYVEVHFRQGEEEQRRVLRTSLKQLNAQFATQPGLFRCHKSYLVNLDAVRAISGNAQGYRLHFEPPFAPVPVSRQYNAFIRQRFAKKP